MKLPAKKENIKRSLCATCNRPAKLCICSAFREINNQVAVILLQHPTEAKKPFATYRIVESCLQNCLLFEGEDFSQLPALNELLARPGYKNYLVFPNEKQNVLTIDIKSGETTEDVKPTLEEKSEVSSAKIQLIFIDGTWRKAKKIFYENNFLQSFPSITFKNIPTSEYEIRRSKLKYSLSLVEACYFSLSALDKPRDYGPLMEALRLMVSKQKTFSPSPPKAF